MQDKAMARTAYALNPQNPNAKVKVVSIDRQFTEHPNRLSCFRLENRFGNWRGHAHRHNLRTHEEWAVGYCGF